MSAAVEFEDGVGGFTATVGSTGSLSSIGRDQGSIDSVKERESIRLDNSGLEVEEDEAMGGDLLRCGGFKLKAPLFGAHDRSDGLSSS